MSKTNASTNLLHSSHAAWRFGASSGLNIWPFPSEKLADGSNQGMAFIASAIIEESRQPNPSVLNKAGIDIDSNFQSARGYQSSIVRRSSNAYHHAQVHLKRLDEGGLERNLVRYMRWFPARVRNSLVIRSHLLEELF